MARRPCGRTIAVLEDDNGDMKRSNDTPSARERLEAAYRGAVYRVAAPAGGIVLSVDERSAGLDARLDAEGVSVAAFVSAANPGSVPLSDAENRARHLRLLERVAASGRSTLPGVSSASDGGWTEASLLVFGIEEEEALELAREFGQAAILVLRAGERCRLRFV